MTGPQPFEEERPVGRDGAALFGATDGLLGRLDRIADGVVSAALGQAPTSRSITFLISGDWGTGKSSALRYIEDRVADELTSRGISGKDTPVVFVWYRAPQHAGHSARASLLYEMVVAIQQLHVDLTEVLMQALGVEPIQFETLDPDLQGHADAMATRLGLANGLNGAVDAGPALELWLKQYLATRGRRLTTVVFIDDLDRCNSSEFVKDVLVATQHWGEAGNHFFVIGADEGRVRASLREHLAEAKRSPDDGLSKYVHVSIALPPVIPGFGDGVSLVRSYLERVRLHEPTRAVLHELLAAPPDGPLTLLEPLLVGCTPRELKRRFNSLIAIVDRADDGPAPEEWSIKRAVLQVRWPRQFQRHIRPAEMQADAAKITRLNHLIALGADALRTDPCAREQSLRRIADGARRSGLKLGRVDALLALYLASDPPWTPPAAEGATLPDTRRHDRRESTDVIEAPSYRDITELMSPPGALPEDELTQRIELLRTTAELRDEEKMRTLFGQTAPVVEAIEELPPSIATVLGNAALAYAAAGLRREALFLHWSAHRANRSHVNVAQNFVDYVLDQQVTGFYRACDEILQRIRADSGGSLRQRLLELRMDLRLRRGGSQDAALDEIVAIATADGSTIGRTDLIDLLELCRDRNRYRDMPAVASVLLDRESGDIAEQASTARIVADTLGGSRRSEDEEYAAEIYRGMMLTGLIRKLSPQSQNHTLQNLGSLLSSRSLTAAAAYVFWCALQIEDSIELRTRLARTVNRLGFADAAEDLLSGHTPASRIPAPATPSALPRPLLPRNKAGRAWFRQHFPSPPYDPPLAPEVWQ